MKTAKDSFSYAWGAYSGFSLHKMKIKDIDWELFKAAMDQGFKNGDTALAMDLPTLDKVIQTYISEAQFGSNRTKGAEYIAKQKNKGYTTTASGLLFKQSKAGNGKKPTISDTALVHYTLKFVDGKIIQSTIGSKPIKMPLNGGAVPGFLEALRMMEEGSTAEVIIPWNLGYGSEGSRNPYTGEMEIEPYTTLIFTITIESIQK